MLLKCLYHKQQNNSRMNNFILSTSFPPILRLNFLLATIFISYKQLDRMHQKHLTVFEIKCFKAKWKNLLTHTLRSILTKLQTALCTMTVITEAPRSGQAGL